MKTRLLLAALLALGAAVASGQGVTPEGPNLDDTGDPVPPTMKARFGTLRFRQERDVGGLAISPDGKIVATRGGNGLVRTFDAATGKELKRMRKQRGAFLSVAFPPDGSFLGCGTNEGVAALTLSDLFESWNETGHMDAGSNEIAFSPDGKTIVSWGSGHEGPGVLRLYSATDGKMIWEKNEPVLGTCAFSPDSRTIAVGVDKEGVSLRDAKNGNDQGGISVPNGQGVVRALAWSKDGKTIAGWGKGAPRVRFLDPASRKETKRLDCVAGDGMDAAAFSPDLATAAFGKERLLVADLSSGKTLHELAETTGRDALVHVLAFAPDGKTVFAGRGGREPSGTARIQAIDVATGADATKLGSREPPEALAFSPDSTLLAIARADEIDVRDVVLHKSVRKLAGRGLSRVAFSPDGKTLAAASRGKVLVFGEKDTEPRTVTPPGTGDSVLAFSLAANVLLAGSPRNDLSLVDLASGKNLRPVEKKSAPGALSAFSPDGKVLALATPSRLS